MYIDTLTHIHTCISVSSNYILLTVMIVEAINCNQKLNHMTKLLLLFHNICDIYCVKHVCKCNNDYET